MKTLVTYETHHGNAKRAAQIIAGQLNCLCVDIDTPYQAENPDTFDRLVLVISFRGPYTAQLTKLYLQRMGEKLSGKQLVVVGVGLFSDVEFPAVAESLRDLCPVATFDSYFIKGQLRVDTLSLEECALLGEFGRMTGMTIQNMGEFDFAQAHITAADIAALEPTPVGGATPEEAPQKKWRCMICGYVHYGEFPPEECPRCMQPSEMFELLD